MKVKLCYNRSMSNKNTYKKGVLNFILYPTGEGTYLAACRELCLIREGKDHELVKLQIMADAKRYFLNVCEHKLGEHLLNQDLPKEIIREFNAYRIKKINENFQKWITDIKDILQTKTKCHN
ncbi:hypothetical protein KKG82_00300 [Patescibacteria group bacterium]|nr:hypothetical protein [Patescibacteria group bacterium]